MPVRNIWTNRKLFSTRGTRYQGLLKEEKKTNTDPHLPLQYMLRTSKFEFAFTDVPVVRLGR